jgi:hypothetical protein
MTEKKYHILDNFNEWFIYLYEQDRAARKPGRDDTVLVRYMQGFMDPRTGQIYTRKELLERGVRSLNSSSDC